MHFVWTSMCDGFLSPVVNCQLSDCLFNLFTQSLPCCIKAFDFSKFWFASSRLFCSSSRNNLCCCLSCLMVSSRCLSSWCPAVPMCLLKSSRIVVLGAIIICSFSYTLLFMNRRANLKIMKTLRIYFKPVGKIRLRCSTGHVLTGDVMK